MTVERKLDELKINPLDLLKLISGKCKFLYVDPHTVKPHELFLESVSADMWDENKPDALFPPKIRLVFWDEHKSEHGSDLYTLNDNMFRKALCRVLFKNSEISFVDADDKTQQLKCIGISHQGDDDEDLTDANGVPFVKITLAKSNQMNNGNSDKDGEEEQDKLTR